MPNADSSPRVSTALRLIVVAACLLTGAFYLASKTRAEEVPPRVSLAELPMTIDERVGRKEPDFAEDILAVLGVDDYVIRSYFKAGELPVGLYAGYYHSQREGDTIHSPLNCLPGAGWLPVEQGRASIPITMNDGATKTIEINRVIISKGLDRQFVYYWYQSHGRVVASEYWGKIYTVVDSVRFHRTDAAMVRVIVPIPTAEALPRAEQAATRFVQELFPLLGRHLPT